MDVGLNRAMMSSEGDKITVWLDMKMKSFSDVHNYIIILHMF